MTWAESVRFGSVQRMREGQGWFVTVSLFSGRRHFQQVGFGLRVSSWRKRVIAHGVAGQVQAVSSAVSHRCIGELDF